MCLQPRTVDAGCAKKSAVIAGDRTVGLAGPNYDGGDAAIGDSVIVYIFIRQAQLPLTQIHGEIGVDGKTLSPEEIAVVVNAFVIGVDAEGGVAADRRVDVRRDVPCSEGIDAGRSDC